MTLQTKVRIAAAVALLAAALGAPLTAQAAPSDGKPLVVWTDEVGDASMAWLDLSKGTASCTPGEVTFSVAIPYLDPKAMNTNRSFSVYRTSWEYAGTRYFADAVYAYNNMLNPTGPGRHSTGFFTGRYVGAVPTITHAAKGTFKDGYGAIATVTVALSDVGVATPDAVLDNITSEGLHYDWYSYYFGSPLTPQVGGQQVDTARPIVNLHHTKGTCTTTRTS